VQFEEKLLENGVIVHWAADAEEHNKIVYSILQKHHVNRMMKSKSMLTEECHLNEFLKEKGVEVIDTDLGERIVQLAEEPPSHIVLPCIHKQKEEIGQLFHEKLGTPEGNSDPQYLTGVAREHMRDTFLTTKGSIDRCKLCCCGDR
jgi:L-lactate dehydrogenase complex protein LldF